MAVTHIFVIWAVAIWIQHVNGTADHNDKRHQFVVIRQLLIGRTPAAV